MRSLRVHAFEPRSEANGPGTRAVLWVQGCTLACPGCFNPGSHGRQGDEMSVNDLFARIAGLGDNIEGVTISGGEPLQQRAPVLRLLERIRAETSLSSILFTGYRWDEVLRMPDATALRDHVDVLIAGRYEQGLRVGRGLRGSANKTVHLFSGRYTQADLDGVPDAEVIIRPDGGVWVTGIDPPVLGSGDPACT
ncbi:4Fe-4S single cluster domain-containing protein [Nonomuraea sp. NPDC046802]|uniref:4Fe-4S single cluster domain-containing protein n=1 Tax=Nonomuraea sp. NPDC046802 TaxID=3154919 RepID=UPI0033FEEDE0